jgi:hypothetical protein
MISSHAPVSTCRTKSDKLLFAFDIFTVDNISLRGVDGVAAEISQRQRTTEWLH